MLCVYRFALYLIIVGNFDPAKPRPSTPPCVKAPANLQFCETIENKFVSLPESNSVLLQDDIEKNYFNSIINNQNVVLNGSNPDCGRLLNGYLCLASMPFCGSSSSLTTSTVGMNECYCERMKATCGVTESHKDLFNCTKLIRCGETSLGKRNEWSFAWLGLGLLFL